MEIHCTVYILHHNMEIGNTDIDQYLVPYSPEWYMTTYEYVKKFEEIISIRYVNFKATVFEYIMQNYVRFFTNGSQFSSGQLLVTDFSARVFFKDCYVGASNFCTLPHSLYRTFNSAPHKNVPNSTLNRSALSSSVVREKVIKYVKQAVQCKNQ